MLVRDKVDDVEHVGHELAILKLSRRELLALQEEAQNPEKLVADVERGLLDLILAALVDAAPQQLDLLFGHSPLDARAARAAQDLVLLSHRYLRLHVAQQHVQNLRAARLLQGYTVPHE